MSQKDNQLSMVAHGVLHAMVQPPYSRFEPVMMKCMNDAMCILCDIVLCSTISVFILHHLVARLHRNLIVQPPPLLANVT